jgi:hypothetical protein
MSIYQLPTDRNTLGQFDLTTQFDMSESKVQRIHSRRWTSRGHQMEQVMVNPDRTVAFINIPKNSSTSVKNALTPTGWEIFDLHEIDQANMHYLVLLRNPFERWISGIAEYLTMYHGNVIDDLSCEHDLGSLPILGQRLALSIIFDKFQFDDHTDLQCSFLLDLPWDQCTFIFIDSDLNTNLNQFLVAHSMAPVKLGNENSASHGTARNLTVKLSIQKMLTRILENSPERREKLQEYLWPDLQLINRVNMVNQINPTLIIQRQ